MQRLEPPAAARPQSRCPECGSGDEAGQVTTAAAWLLTATSTVHHRAGGRRRQAGGGTCKKWTRPAPAILMMPRAPSKQAWVGGAWCEACVARPRRRAAGRSWPRRPGSMTWLIGQRTSGGLLPDAPQGVRWFRFSAGGDPCLLKTALRSDQVAIQRVASSMR